MVLGEIDHTTLGHVVLVRTAYSVLADQHFDIVLPDRLEPATMNEYVAHAEDVKREASQRVDALTRSIASGVLQPQP